MKTKTTLTLAIIVLFISPLLLSTVSAQTVIAGVSKGQTFDYSYNIMWTSNDTSSLPPAETIEYNNTQKIQFKITDVSGSVISVDFFRQFKNGTVASQSGNINLDSGTTNIPYGFLIIGANLSKDQKVYPNGGHQIITDTTTRTYSGNQKETNVISGGDSSEKMTTYFDKITGIAVEYTYEIYSHDGEYLTTSTERMVNINSEAWAAIPEYSMFAIVIIFILATTAAFTLARRRA
jgi:hypothetical protein